MSGTVELVWDAPGGVKKVVMAADVTPKEALSIALGRLGLRLDQGLLAVRVSDRFYEVVKTDEEGYLEPGQYVILNASR